MISTHTKSLLSAVSIAALLTLAGCSGGGGASTGDPTPPPVSPAPPPSPPTPAPPPPPPSPPTGNDSAFASAADTSRFLTQATFGPTQIEVSRLTGTSASEWIRAEFAKPESLYLPVLQAYQALQPDEEEEEFDNISGNATTFGFWRYGIEGNDQLRQRMVYALSQIIVVSNFGGETLTDIPEGVTYYADILSRNAFGNYRDLLEEITYSPAMGHYLTYMGNQKADPVTGRMPDENYARELLQLFTVGVVELQPNGEPRLDANGKAVELYDNMDITGLARVFTGLNFDETIGEDIDYTEVWLAPMAIYPEDHSQEPKTFLNCSIAASTPAAESIDQALDCIMAHPNIGPFVGRQLIQRFTTSNPDPDYVERVAAAFDSGTYALPNGTNVGTGRKGDLQATLSAVLFDHAVRNASALNDDAFGKIREPVLRFTHWARAFDADASHPEYASPLYDLGDANILSQHPFRARSVFNFYRPGFVPPGTQSGALGMTVPELQIVNATSTPGYMNFMTYWAFGGSTDTPLEELREEYLEFGFPIDDAALQAAFVPNYTTELDLAGDADALVTHLNDLLAYGTLSSETRSAITAAVNQVELDDADDTGGLQFRVGLAVLLVMTSPDYLVQR